MWALTSRVPPSRPNHVGLIPSSTKPPTLSHVVVRATIRHDNNNNNNLKPTELQLKSKLNQDDQISGSDVLWAMSKAANKKSKQRNKKKNDSLSGRGELVVGLGQAHQSDDDDDDNVRPLVVNPDWAAMLADLEKRLNELCDSNQVK